MKDKSDSFPIAIDLGPTYYLSDRRSVFEGVLTQVRVKIPGITDSKGALEGKDTVQWKVQVEHGKRQVFNIPKALLVEASLPFQHTWSGTQAIIGDEEVKLQQGNCCFSKTIKISWEINIPIMPSAPGFTQFKAVTKVGTHPNENAEMF
jgi:hypothetical protein